MADEELMQLVQSGQDGAFTVLFQRHGGSAYALAYRMVGTKVAAEDVVQESFLSLWRTGARYDPVRGSVRSWILGIVHHRAIDNLRRATVHSRRRAGDDGMLAELHEARERTDVEAARREETREVRTVLDVLPAEQRRVIELGFYGGFTHAEIADMLELPVGTVKGRMRLGLHKMRRELGDRVEAPA